MPYSPQGFEYWDEQIYFGVTGREVKPGKLSPEELVEVLRYTVQNPVRLASRYRASNDSGFRTAAQKEPSAKIER